MKKEYVLVLRREIREARERKKKAILDKRLDSAHHNEGVAYWGGYLDALKFVAKEFD